MPSDFDRIRDDTVWNNTDQRKLFEAILPSTWAELKNGIVGVSSINDYFRIRGEQVLLYPTPSDKRETVSFEYITDEIIRNTDGDRQTEWRADTDEFVLDDYLLRLGTVWRLLKIQGRPYAEEQRDYDLALRERISKNSGRKTVRHYEQYSVVRANYIPRVTP